MGVQQNYPEAFVWAEIADTLGDPGADNIKAEVRQFLSPNQLNVAKEEASNWLRILKKQMDDFLF